MSTGTYIVTSALQKIGAHSVLKQADPESLENGRKALNSYIAQLYDNDIDIGAVPLQALGDELSEPMGATNYIVANLALLLEPDHSGSQISQQLRVTALRGENWIRNKYQTIDQPKPVVRNTLPTGAGNFGRSHRAFFKKGATIG
tara:strand:+ start:782 stop:1216 length:435 start_codon:yes stop_codon:yes gene_type:complete